MLESLHVQDNILMAESIFQYAAIGFNRYCHDTVLSSFLHPQNLPYISGRCQSKYQTCEQYRWPAPFKLANIFGNQSTQFPVFQKRIQLIPGRLQGTRHGQRLPESVSVQFSRSPLSPRIHSHPHKISCRTEKTAAMRSSLLSQNASSICISFLQ